MGSCASPADVAGSLRVLRAVDLFAFRIVAVIYTSLVALAQEDMKKLIAYSSVAHMAFVTIGAFTLQRSRRSAGSIIDVEPRRGFGGAFPLVGVVYDRIHSREIETYGGLVHRMPFYAFVFFCLPWRPSACRARAVSSARYWCWLAHFRPSTWVAALIATGMVLGAAYMLYLYRRVIFGELKEHLMKITDLNKREMAIFAPL